MVELPSATFCAARISQDDGRSGATRREKGYEGKRPNGKPKTAYIIGFRFMVFSVQNQAHQGK